MNHDWLVPAIQTIGHVLLMALPGLAPALLLPPARLFCNYPEHPLYRIRAKVWIACMAVSIPLLASPFILTLTIPPPDRLWPALCSMLLAGAAYIRFGANQLAAYIEQIHQRLLYAAAILALACSLFMLANVLMRYLLSTGFGWTREAVIYCHAACFMLAAAGTLHHDKHVRIDIMREHWNKNTRAQIEMFGSLFLLTPVMILILHVYAPQLALSWGAGSGQLETSNESDGLPLAFLFKSLIPLFAITMLAQGWASAWRSAQSQIPPA